MTPPNTVENKYLSQQVNQHSAEILELTKYAYGVNASVTGLMEAQKAMQTNFSSMFAGFLETQKSLMHELAQLQKDLNELKSESKTAQGEKNVKSKLINAAVTWWPLWVFISYSVFTHHNFPEFIHKITGG